MVTSSCSDGGNGSVHARERERERERKREKECVCVCVEFQVLFAFAFKLRTVFCTWRNCEFDVDRCSCSSTSITNINYHSIMFIFNPYLSFGVLLLIYMKYINIELTHVLQMKSHSIFCRSQNSTRYSSQRHICKREYAACRLARRENRFSWSNYDEFGMQNEECFIVITDTIQLRFTMEGECAC